jgi:hypothetical protein
MQVLVLWINFLFSSVRLLLIIGRQVGIPTRYRLWSILWMSEKTTIRQRSVFRF